MAREQFCTDEVRREEIEIEVRELAREGGALPERCSSQVQKAESLPAGRSRHTRNGAGS